MPETEEDLGVQAAPPASWPTSTTSAWSTSGRATTTLSQVGPGTLTGLQIDPGTAFYPGNGITPGPGGFVLDPSRPVEVNWRQSVLGPRLQSSQNTGQRLLLGFDGQFAGWELRYRRLVQPEQGVDHIHSGYVDDRAAALGIANGTLNPFGPQTDAGLAYLGSHALSGDFRTSVGRVKGLDARASREIGDWFGAGAGGPGAGRRVPQGSVPPGHPGLRRQRAEPRRRSPPPRSAASGNLKAQYAELNVPCWTAWNSAAAFRHDKYSDFGSTSNPKYSFRFQPFRQLVLRGAYSEGFRAPSLYELYNPTFTTYTSANYDDPRLCAGGHASQAASPTATAPSSSTTPPAAIPTCDRKPRATLPWAWSTSRCATLSVGLDFWWIRIANQIAEFPKRRSSPTRRPTPDASCARPTALSITSSPDWPTSAR
ncbi:TonB-dependent receptor [Pseudomonas aeruginosa]